MKTITVLLTKYSDLTSQIVYYASRGDYTHSSISIEGSDNFYSFNFYGFCIETPEKHRRKGVKHSLACELLVSDEAYERVKERIDDMIVNSKKYRYTRLGLALAILKIPYKWKYRYFCSQFVAEILKECADIPLKQNTNIYLPNHFYHELKDSIHLKKMTYNVIG